MKKSDQELMNQKAEEYAFNICEIHGEAVVSEMLPIEHNFKAGWNAACKELDDVRAGEVAQLSDSLQMACDERDKLKAMAERLAQALEIEMGNNGTRQAEEALAEWTAYKEKK